MLPARRQALLTCVFVTLSALGGMALLAAAALAPAPPAAVPVLVLACIACTVVATLELPVSIAVLRAPRRDAQALSALRRQLERLPETEHPLGL